MIVVCGKAVGVAYRHHHKTQDERHSDHWPQPHLRRFDRWRARLHLALFDGDHGNQFTGAVSRALAKNSARQQQRDGGSRHHYQRHPSEPPQPARIGVFSHHFAAAGEHQQHGNQRRGEHAVKHG